MISAAQAPRTWPSTTRARATVPQTDPFGVTYAMIEDAGVPVDHGQTSRNNDLVKGHAVHPAQFGTAGAPPLRPSSWLGPIQLHGRQHRRKAHRQGRDDVGLRSVEGEESCR